MSLASTDWRFFSLKRKRQAVVDALGELEEFRRLGRFLNCGHGAFVESAELPQSSGAGCKKMYRIRAKRCGDAMCPACSRERMRRVCRNLCEFLHARKQRFRFMTLTLCQSDRALPEQIKQIQTAFRKLRVTRVWKSSVKNAVWTMEIKLSRTGRWNVHFHLICSGKWIDQKALARAWDIASGGSYIVDIRAADERAPVELTKYMSKAYDLSVIKNPEKLREFIKGTSGRRLFGVLGKDWRGLRLSASWKNPEDIELDWQYVDLVDAIVKKALAGDPSSCQLVDSLPALQRYCAWLAKQDTS